MISSLIFYYKFPFFSPPQQKKDKEPKTNTKTNLDNRVEIKDEKQIKQEERKFYFFFCQAYNMPKLFPYKRDEEEKVAKKSKKNNFK